MASSSYTRITACMSKVNMLDPNYIFRLTEESPIETEGTSPVTATRVGAISYTDGDSFKKTHQDTYILNTQTGRYTVRQSDVTEVISLNSPVAVMRHIQTDQLPKPDTDTTEQTESQPDPYLVSSSVEYDIDPDGVLVTPDIALHHETGDSELEYVLVSSNPDDGSQMTAFGLSRNEIAQLKPLSQAVIELDYQPPTE